VKISSWSSDLKTLGAVWSVRVWVGSYRFNLMGTNPRHRLRSGVHQGCMRLSPAVVASRPDNVMLLGLQAFSLTQTTARNAGPSLTSRKSAVRSRHRPPRKPANQAIFSIFLFSIFARHWGTPQVAVKATE
jgi:hypothetical protein